MGTLQRPRTKTQESTFGMAISILPDLPRQSQPKKDFSMSRINGKPTLIIPSVNTDDVSDAQIQQVVQTAADWVADLVHQAEMDEWLNDPVAQAEYQEWSKSIEPSLEEYDAMMDAAYKDEVKKVHGACHDYGKVIAGDFPTLDAVMLALDEDRLDYRDDFNSGFLTITGQDACHIVFSID